MGGIIVDAYGERKYQEVMQDTWGHLAPEPGTKYEGYLTFAHSDYSSQGSIIIEARFEGLDDSPWFFQDLNDYIADKTKDEKGGAVFRFDGTYKRFKNGRCQFSGVLYKIPLLKRRVQ